MKKTQPRNDHHSTNSYAKYKIIQPAYEKDCSLAEVARNSGIPLRTLQRWLKNYHTNGLAGLKRKQRCDNGTHRHFSQQLVEYTQGLALQKPLRNIVTIYRLVCEAAKKLNEPAPSYHSIYHVVHAIPEDMKVLAHEGQKSYQQIFELLYIRHASRPNEIWQADHSLLDITLLNNRSEPQRPWLTIIMDDYSRAIAGYYLSFEAPSALQTSLALRQAIWCKMEPHWQICGIPEQLYTDHGSDFTSQHIETVCADLKIKLIFSAVGVPQGRGKIERFFKTINQKLLYMLPGYTPHSNAPQETLLSFAQFENILKDFLIVQYHGAVHSMTKQTPVDRWTQAGFLPQLPDSLENLDLLLLNTAKSRKIHQDGIRFQDLRYIEPTLAAYIGEHVIIRYDPRDMTEIRVFFEGQFLCRALCQDLISENISLKQIEGARQQRKQQLKQEIKQRLSLVDQLLCVNQTQNLEKPTQPILERSSPKKLIKKIRLYEND